MRRRESPAAIRTLRRATVLSNCLNGKCIRLWARGILRRPAWDTNEMRLAGNAHGPSRRKGMNFGGSAGNRSRTICALVVLTLMLPFVRAASAQSDWKKQWETTVEAGRKEGEVVIY